MARSAIGAAAEMIGQIYAQQRSDYEADMADGAADGPPAPVRDDVITAQATWYGLSADDVQLRAAVNDHLLRPGGTDREVP